MLTSLNFHLRTKAILMNLQHSMKTWEQGSLVMNTGQRSDTFTTAFHDAVTDSIIVPFSLAPLVFLQTYMGISRRDGFGAIIGVREYRGHYNGNHNKYLPEEVCKNTVCAQKIPARTSAMHTGNGWKR